MKNKPVFLRFRLVGSMVILLGSLIIESSEEHKTRKTRIEYKKNVIREPQFKNAEAIKSQNSLIEINPEYKIEIINWYNKYINKKLTQEEISLIVQRMYYLFESLNEIFKKIDINKNRIVQITQALNEINEKIKKLEHSKNINNAFDKIVKRLDSFKIKSNALPEKSLFEFFSYLATTYEVLYNSLENKTITIGPDKNKKLPALNIPNEKEIEIVLNKLFKSVKSKRSKKINIKRVVLKPKASPKKIRLTPIQTTINLTPIAAQPIVIQPEQPVSEVPVQTTIPVSTVPTVLPVVAPEVPAIAAIQPAIIPTQLTITSNDLCSFLNNFQTIPGIPTPMPDNLGIDDFNIFITNFNNSIKTLNGFITDYSNQVKNFQSTNDLQNFSVLLNNMQSAKTNNDTVKGVYDNCINTPPANSSCSSELLNYITAINGLYDSYADILEFLNKYNLAPSWANPVVRQNQIVGISNQNQTKVATLNNQILEINTIQGFDSATFVSQINAGIKYLQQEIQPCYDAIKTINNAINNLNITIKTTSDAIKARAEQLQIPSGQGHATGPSEVQTLVPALVGLGLDIAGIAGIVGGLDMPGFAAAQVVINNIALTTGADTDFINSISAQINKNLISDWSFQDHSAGGIMLSLGKGTLDVIENILWGPAALAGTLQASTTAILSGGGQATAQAGQSAISIGSSMGSVLGGSSDDRSGNQDGCTYYNQCCNCQDGQAGICQTCHDQSCENQLGSTALLCNCGGYDGASGCGPQQSPPTPPNPQIWCQLYGHGTMFCP